MELADPACDKPNDEELRRIKKALTAFHGHNLRMNDAEHRLVLTLVDGAMTALIAVESRQLMTNGRHGEAAAG